MKPSVLVAAICAASLAAEAVAAADTGGYQAVLTSQQLADRVAIDALGTEYFFRLDHGLAETLPALFTEDGVQDFNDGTPPLKGRDAIAAYYAKRSKTAVTRHVSTNLRIVFEGPGRARVWRTFTHYIGQPPAPMIAAPSVREYEEVVVRAPSGEWLYAYRRVIPLFDRATTPP